MTDNIDKWKFVCFKITINITLNNLNNIIMRKLKKNFEILKNYNISNKLIKNYNNTVQN